jgi:hypothetical protein
MVNDAQWLNEFDERTQECIDAALEVALEPSPRIWPFYRDYPWNPLGHPLSRKEPPEKIFDPELHDERTLKEPRVDRRGTRPR